MPNEKVMVSQHTPQTIPTDSREIQDKASQYLQQCSFEALDSSVLL